MEKIKVSKREYDLHVNQLGNEYEKKHNERLATVRDLRKAADAIRNSIDTFYKELRDISGKQADLQQLMLEEKLAYKNEVVLYGQSVEIAPDPSAISCEAFSSTQLNHFRAIVTEAFRAYLTRHGASPAEVDSIHVRTFDNDKGHMYLDIYNVVDTQCTSIL